MTENTKKNSNKISASPKARKFARELGVDINKVSGSERIDEIGLELRSEKKRIFVDMVKFDSPAEKAGIDFDWEILGIKVPIDRPAKQWMYLPSFILLLFIITAPSCKGDEG